MFYVQDNEKKYTGFDDAGEAVKAYKKAKEKSPYWWSANTDIGLLITKEPIARRSTEQIMQGKDWVALSCVSEWDKYSQNLKYTNAAPIIREWIYSGKLSIKELSSNGTILMAELDKAKLHEKGCGWDDKYTMYLAKGLDGYYKFHNQVETVFKYNIPNCDDNKDFQTQKHCTPGEYIKAMLSLTESVAENKWPIIMSPNETEWSERNRIDANREYARFVKGIGEAAIKLRLNINAMAQAKALKYMDGYNWEFIEHSFPRYHDNKQIALLQNELLPMLNYLDAQRPKQYEKWTDKAIAEAVIQRTANIFEKAISNVKKKNGHIPEDICQFDEYLGNVRDKLDDEKWQKVQQEVQKESESGLYGYLTNRYPSQKWDKNIVDTIEYWAKQDGELDISTKEALDKLLPAEIADAAINAIVTEKDRLELEEPNQESYLGYTRKELSQRQKMAERFARDYAVMPGPSQESQRVYNNFISALKKEQHKDNSKDISVIDTARKIMASLSPAQRQCVGNILKAKGGNTGGAIEKILAKEICTAGRKKNKEEDRER